MDKIVLEKAIYFTTNIEQLTNVSVKDSIDYKLLDDGCSVIGVVKLTGIATTLKGMEPFEENIDVDIFAPFEQVIDKSKFSLTVNDYEYQILRNIAVFKIQLKVSGFRKINEPEQPKLDNDTYNLTNEIDEMFEDSNLLYDNDLLKEFEDIEQKEDFQPANIDDEIKDEMNSEFEIEKEIEKPTMIVHHSPEIPIPPILDTPIETRDEPINNWASDLFKQKESYVTFYKISRKDADDEK